MSDQIIEGFRCPDCQEESLTYNGNYFCTNNSCRWAMPDHKLPTIWEMELMIAYMESEKIRNPKLTERMDFYLNPMKEHLQLCKDIVEYHE